MRLKPGTRQARLISRACRLVTGVDPQDHMQQDDKGEQYIDPTAPAVAIARVQAARLRAKARKKELTDHGLS